MFQKINFKRKIIIIKKCIIKNVLKDLLKDLSDAWIIIFKGGNWDYTFRNGVVPSTQLLRQ